MFTWLNSNIRTWFGIRHTKNKTNKKHCKQNVRFSPSTLHRDLEHQVEKFSSVDPYFNFLMFYNIKSQNLGYDIEGLSFHEIGRASQSALWIWRKMSSEERKPYIEMAFKAKDRKCNNQFISKRATETRTYRARLEMFKQIYENENPTYYNDADDVNKQNYVDVDDEKEMEKTRDQLVTEQFFGQ